MFRIALTILKLGEAEIKGVNDPMEVFQVVQNIPRKLVDAVRILPYARKVNLNIAKILSSRVHFLKHASVVEMASATLASKTSMKGGKREEQPMHQSEQRH